MRVNLTIDQVLTGTSSKIRKLKQLILRLALFDCAILLFGETGTGKSTLARLIHDLSPRRKGPFIYINCGQLPPTLIESILFGHERGAFSGATHLKKGLLEQADKGTVFLDELDALPIELQVKILTFVETKEIVRIGSSTAARPIQLDVRIIAATNKDLDEEIRERRFREDLYFRLSDEEITLPPLRERQSDIVPIANNILEKISPKSHLSEDAEAHLQRHLWPGNIRELEKVIGRAVRRCDGELISDSLLESLIRKSFPETKSTEKLSKKARRLSVTQFVKKHGPATVSRIQSSLQIPRRTLQRDLQVLSDRGLLKPMGAGRNCTYIHSRGA